MKFARRAALSTFSTLACIAALSPLMAAAQGAYPNKPIT